MVATLGLQAGQGGEAFDGGITRPRAAEPLEQLLQDEAGGEDGYVAAKRTSELGDLRRALGRVPAQGQRPHAGVDEQTHSRDRSAL